MTTLKPAPEGQPTSSIQRFLEYAADQKAEWEGNVALRKRQLASAESMVRSYTLDVLLYEYQLSLREAEGRVD